MECNNESLLILLLKCGHLPHLHLSFQFLPLNVDVAFVLKELLLGSDLIDIKDPGAPRLLEVVEEFLARHERHAGEQTLHESLILWTSAIVVLEHSDHVLGCSHVPCLHLLLRLIRLPVRQLRPPLSRSPQIWQKTELLRFLTVQVRLVDCEFDHLAHHEVQGNERAVNELILLVLGAIKKHFI